MAHRSAHAVLCFALFLFGASSPIATIAVAGNVVEWEELVDAGPLPNSAQEPTGNGVLTSIMGTIASSPTDVPINDLSEFGASVADVDLYEIFIADPDNFSAATLGGDNPPFDSSLALFDENGLGVYFNDDVVRNDGNSFLPDMHGLGPMEPGTYYLAIFDDDLTPVSQLNFNGPIFPEVGSPFTQVVGPTGPGGALGLIDWFPEAPNNASRDYTILLTGVTVPEPTLFVLGVSALSCVGGLRARRRRRHMSCDASPRANSTLR